MCGTDGNKHCAAYEAFTVASGHASCKTFAAVQLVVFVVTRCGTASLGEWYLKFWDHCVVLQCGCQSTVMQCHITEEQRSFFWFVHWLLRNGLIHIIRPTGNVKSKLLKQRPYQTLYQVLKRKFISGVCSYTWQFHYGKCDVLSVWYVGLAFDYKNGDQKDKWKALKETFENVRMT